MLEINDSEYTYKGTRILVGNEKRMFINKMVDCLITLGFQEINIPIIQAREVFASKVGQENNNLMFNFTDRGERDLCLAPEYTAVVQKLALKRFKYEKDLRLFYVQECFRGERPQLGRYRQFTQLGVEIINPMEDYQSYLVGLANQLINLLEIPTVFSTNEQATRGLDYYKEGQGFEIACETLGNARQVCGGGSYEGGIGFALGVDRLLKAKIDTLN